MNMQRQNVFKIFLFNHFYFLALENGCVAKSGQISVKRENSFELSVLNQILLFIEMTPGVFLTSLTIEC